MKKITLWLFALFTCWQISAQTTVTIGAGTSDSGTGTNASPVYRSSAGSAFNFSQSMELLTASDLTAAGITSGSTITKIAYYKTNTFTMSAGRSVTVNIYMKNSAATSFGATTPFSTYIAGATQCYSNAAVTATEIPGAAGWVEFTFSTPFNYTGGSIEVGINWAINAGAGNPTTGGFAWQYTTVAGNQAAGTSDSVAITGNLTSTATRLYNTQLTYTNSPCSGVPAPGNTIAPATICAGASANLTLQNSTIGSGVTYQWYNSGGAIAGAINPTYLIPSVVSSDTYHCDVTCGASTTSSSNLVVGPSANPTLPWSENFDTLAVGNDIFPSCWGYSNTTNTWSIATAPTAYSGANSLRRTWSTDGWAFTPMVTLTAGVSYRFSYYVITNDTTIGYDNTVAVGNSQSAAAMTTTLLTQTGYQGVVWTKVNNEFTPTVSGDYSFGLHVVAPVSPNGINFDNFVIELSPTCPDQTGLIVGNITSTGADTSWDDMSATGALGYEYAITTSATPPASGTATTSAFYIASGLLPQTVYYLHVRSTCTGSTFGNWATTTFTTACVPLTTLPHSESFDSVATPSCWTTSLITGSTNWAPDDSSDGVPSARTGARFAGKTWDGDDDALLISPVYNLAAYPTDQTRLNVWIYRGTNGASTDRTTFYANTTNNLAGATMLIDVPLPMSEAPVVASAGWYNYIVDVPLSFNTGGNFYIIAEGRTSSSFSSYSVGFDDYKFELSPTCPDQTGLIVGNITSTGADTSWDDMSATGALGYEYAITTSATPPASGTATTSTFYIASGLLPQTVYYLHVRSTCTGSTFGNWSTVSFTTLCNSITTLPWSENFDALATGTNIFPSCWGYSNTTNTWSISTYTTAYSGANSLRRTYGTDGWAFTPMIALTAGVSYRFSYYVRTDDGVVGYDNTIAVGNSQSEAAMTTTLLTQTGYQNPVWTKVNNEFTPTTSGDYSFGIHVVADFSPNGINFDNFVLELSPTCPDQTGLVVGNITASGADTSWDDMSVTGALGYEYAITTSATPPASGTATTSTFYIASGLLPQTVYYLHVRSTCTGSTFGNWATISFTTACTSVNVPYSQNFESATVPNLPLCTSQQNVGTGNLWQTVSAPGYGFTTKALRYSYNGANAANVWFYSTGLNLVGGTTYKIAYDYGSTGATFPEKLKVAYGTSASAAAMTTPLADHPNVVNATPLNNVVQFTPATTGVYYFGFNAYSDADEFYLFVDNIVVDVFLSSSTFDKSTFTAYPNPVKDVLNLSYKSAISNVKVINLLGQEVLNTKTNGNDVQVNMSALNAGAYIVNITVEDTVHTIKVIKE